MVPTLATKLASAKHACNPKPKRQPKVTIGEDLAPICSPASGRHDLRNAAACMTASSARWQRKTKQNFGEKAVSLGAPSAGAYSNSSFPGGEPPREIATRSGTCVPPAGTGLGCNAPLQRRRTPDGEQRFLTVETKGRRTP